MYGFRNGGLFVADDELLCVVGDLLLFLSVLLAVGGVLFGGDFLR